MSFAKLKATREAQTKPSYVSSDTPESRPRAAGGEQAAQASTSSSHASSLPQNANEPQQLYKNIPKTLLEIRTDAVKGRGLWATQNIGAGQTILALPPYAAALSTANLSSYCSACTKPKPASGSSPLKRCTQCRIVHYCDAACQTADWALHKLECVALRRGGPPSEDVEGETSSGALIPNDAIRCLARMMWRRKKKGLESDWSKELDAMQAHLPISPSAQEQHTHLALSLVRFLGLTSPQELAELGVASGAELARIVAKFTTNTFTLSAPDLTPLGACIAPPVALINHDCQPNAVVVFPGTKQSHRASHARDHSAGDTPRRRGKQILTAYIDTTLPRIQRQQALQETYNFDCRCSLCTSDDPDPRESVWCPKKCGGICPMPTEENPLSQCSRCKSVLRDTDAVLDAIRVGQQGLDKATAVQFSDRAKAQQLTSKLIPILTSAGLPPAAHPLLALRRLHLAMLIEDVSGSVSADDPSSPLAQKTQTQTQLLDEAIITATQICKGLDAVLPYAHPVRGLARAEAGKLLAVDEPAPAPTLTLTNTNTTSTSTAPPHSPPTGPARLKLARDTLLHAHTELQLGFGKANAGGEVGRAVREDVVGLERELGGVDAARGGGGEGCEGGGEA
ncbi:hypothetical protein HMN09_00558000 [Mycena chlorophos]|uniref:SET domain-containing protein n=1 Tax=Mycena chlorophos TaxID=658473 RepID=A0A8H6TAM4_MYCCL|nr:hypothetical protein HMN09_00558000 [Mycena chlorophos]